MCRVSIPNQIIPKKVLQDRAFLLQKARDFFAARGIMEVDCCALASHAPIDVNIDVIEASVSSNAVGFLHTSPEYAMKQLLANGCGDIYYLGHVFRQGEIGPRHNPEFTMAEWYRIGMPFHDLIQETCQFLFLFLGEQRIRTLSYREAFSLYAGLDYSRASLLELRQKIKMEGIELPSSSEEWTRDAYLHLLLSHVIEPRLGRKELTVLTDYPPTEAALARIVEKNGEPVAERFEIYSEGVELCNGYHEAADSNELRERFIQENAQRELKGKKTYLLDENFLSAMKQNFPDCCGVSVGFDRALMLRHQSQSLRDVLPFAWSHA